MGLSLGLLLTLNSKPLYSATSQIFVSTPAAVLDVSALAQGSNFTQQRVKSYAQLINAEGTLLPVIQKLGLETTPEKLGRQIRATVPIDTVIIDVNVKDESPVMAMQIANAVASEFSNSVQSLELPGVQGETSVKASLSRQATVPSSPVSPKLSLNVALGLLLGFTIGLFIALIIHFGDLTVKNSDHLFGLPLLGAFKFEKKAKGQPLVSRLQPYEARTEEYRQLRTSVLHLAEQSRASVIGITSALPVEGKTTTSINFAYSLQEAGYRVILIEADMRRPQISQYTENKDKVNKQTGLSSLLQLKTKTNLAQEIRKSIFHDQINKIDVILSGVVPNTPTELLSNGNLSKILASIRKSYDFVILDCPPVLPIADTPVLSEYVDEFILVVKAGNTRVQQFKGTVEILQKVNARIMGVVLNMIPLGRKSDEYGYQYGSYRAYNYKSSPGYAPRNIDNQKSGNDSGELAEMKPGDRSPRYAPKSDRSPRYAPKSDRSPRYAPKSDRSPRYAPKSDRSPRYAPKSDRSPRYAPKSDRSRDLSDEKDFDFEKFIAEITGQQEEPDTSFGKSVQKKFGDWLSRQKNRPNKKED
ncbi:Exopolysaccharide synthesis protein [Candidatus Nanopelagicaceae bacterium]